MSIARPCPYSVEYGFCKYEKDIGTPNLKMCDKCNWNPKKRAGSFCQFLQREMGEIHSKI